MADNKDDLPPLKERPLVTFALFAYNQEKYIREAVEGAFAQTYEPLEIILSDDCSTDRTFEIFKELAALYKGPHLIRARKNSKNLGILNHVLTVAQEATGEYLVVAAGDDVSLPPRAGFLAMQLHLKNFGAISGSFFEISEQGVTLSKKVHTIDDFKDKKNHFPWVAIQGATACYRTKLLKALPLTPARVMLEDFAFSILIHKMGWETAAAEIPLIKHRIHTQNIAPKHSYLATLDEVSAERKIAKMAGLASETLNYVLSTKFFQHEDGTKIISKLTSLKNYLHYNSIWLDSTLAERIKLLYYSAKWGGTKFAVYRLMGANTYFSLLKIKNYLFSKKNY